LEIAKLRLKHSNLVFSFWFKGAAIIAAPLTFQGFPASYYLQQKCFYAFYFFISFYFYFTSEGLYVSNLWKTAVCFWENRMFLNVLITSKFISLAIHFKNISS